MPLSLGKIAIKMGWKEIKIKSWEHFVSQIDTLKQHEESTLPTWIFRGQSDFGWALKPTILRKLEYYGFLKEKALGIEKNVYREFTSKYHNYEFKDIPSINKSQLVIWFTIMQHYSCPTRLLDWTFSPYIAIYFTVKDLFEKDGTLFGYNDSRLNKLVSINFKGLKDINEEELLDNPDKDLLYSIMPTHVSKRAALQKSTFTISTNIMRDHETLIDEIFSLDEKEPNKCYYVKILIPKELKLEFLARLKLMNIEDSVLFPDLDGLGRSISQIIDIRGWKKN
jgi:hypothetical protein